MRVLADQKQFAELTGRLAAAISAEIARTSDGAPWALVGIRSRGDVLAVRLAEKLGKVIGDRVGSLDITLYRDDLSEVGSNAVVRTTEVPFVIDGLHVVLIDDVLMTGRSIRAALQSLMDLGRPRRVWLGVLVDRGGRELPIAPDFVGLNLTDSKANQMVTGEVVAVQIKPTDPRDEITILPGKKGAS